jgi:hypothetical protein
MEEPESTAEFRIVDLYPDGELDGYSVGGTILEHGDSDLSGDSIYYLIEDGTGLGRFRITLTWEREGE